MKPREAVWALERQPVKLRCPSKVVFGFLYAPESEVPVELEATCRARGCRRDGFRTIHVFDASGDCRTIFAPERDARRGR
jgi:hypothetical protein